MGAAVERRDLKDGNSRRYWGEYLNRILFTLAEQYHNAGLYDEAIRIADDAIALNARHAGAISTKGLSIASQGDFESALAILEPLAEGEGLAVGSL